MTVIRVPLKTMNRHGLITGAIGTGKTKNVQILPKQLHNFGFPILMMDVKVDFIGIA